LKNNKAIGADSVVNEFLKSGGSEVRNKLLKIMNMISEEEEVPNNFRKTLVKPLYKKEMILKLYWWLSRLVKKHEMAVIKECK